MNPAHLGLIVAALPEERAAWALTLKYLAEHSVAGVFFGSIRSIWKGGPGRPPIQLGDKKVKESIQALRNLRIIVVIGSVDGSAVTNQIHVLLGVNQAYVEELAFALSRPAAWVDRRAAYRLWSCLERRRSSDSKWWHEVGPRFLGERMWTSCFLSDEFLGQQKFPFGQAAKPDPTPGSGLGKLDPGVGSGLGGGVRFPGSGWGPVSPQKPRSCLTAVSTTVTEQGLFGPMEVIQMTPEEQARQAQAAKERLAAFDKSGLLGKASDLPPVIQRRKERKRRWVTSRAHDVREWAPMRNIMPHLDRMFPAPCICILPKGHTGWVETEMKPHVGDPSTAPETVTEPALNIKGIDPSKTNPDALKVVETLMFGVLDLFKAELGKGSMEVPELALQAWIAYSRLFMLEYQGKGDQRAVPCLRLLFRRMIAPQKRIQKTDILPRMAGFVYRMDMARRNRKGLYYPKQDWLDIYGRDPKYSTAWTDALFSNTSIKSPMDFMQSVKPFVELTNGDGTMIVSVLTPAEKLAMHRMKLADRTALLKPMEDEMWGEGAWDKLSVEERTVRAIGQAAMDEMKSLEKELEGDPATQVVQQ